MLTVFCIIIVAMHNYDCITRRAVFRNTDIRPTPSSGRVTPSAGSSKVVQKACSATIDFECPADDFHLVQLSGT